MTTYEPCAHPDPFVVGPPDFGGRLGAQNMCCPRCGRSEREIADDKAFATHMVHVRAGDEWRADCAWCPERRR